MYKGSRLASKQSKKFAVYKKTKFYLWGFLLAISIFAFVYCLSWISYLDFMSVKDISVNGAREEIANMLKAEAYKAISGAYLGLFSKSNLLIYPHDKLFASVASSVPQIRSLSIKRDGDNLLIEVTEKVPEAVICLSLPEFSPEDGSLMDSDDCFLADQNGLIFDRQASSTAVSENLYYMPSLPNVLSLELQRVSVPNFSGLQRFYEGSKKAGLNPDFILIKDDGEYEMYAYKTVMYFNDSRPMDEQLSNLISFWNHPPNAKYRNGLASGFEYLDVRYGSNVFYRLKQ